MKSRKYVIVIPFVIVAAIAGYLILERSGVSVSLHEKRADRQQITKRTARKVKTDNSDKLTTKRRWQPEHPYSEADKQLSEAIQAAMAAEDMVAVVKAAKLALSSPNPDVRHDAVDALGWFGEDALPELTVWMADRDEDVAQAAVNHWEQGVSEIEDAGDRLKISLFALNTITDEDALAMIGSHFANAATELIDDEEDEAMAAQKRTEVVQALADIIAEGKEQCANAAREAYEDVTGNKWISIEEAEKYLKDPDNYEEPESPEGN